MPTFRPIALITGASSGIGAALAREFAAHGHEAVLVARNEQQLIEVANEIGSRGHPRPHVLAIDLTRLDASARIGHELTTRGLEPAFVINNAGFGLAGTADELDRAEQLAMVDLNIRSLTELSLRWIDAMQRHHGGLLNVASVAGFLSGPRMAVYYASKAYVLSFTEALHAELAPKGVRVTVLCPGPVPTRFHSRAGLRESAAQSPVLSQSPEKVAREGYTGLMAGRRLVVPGIGNKLVTFLVRFGPRGLMLKLVERRQRELQKPTGPQWPQRRVSEGTSDRASP